MAPKDPKVRFQEGEKVLCFHGPLMYEAKCMKYRIKDKTVNYFIHYSGWNKNWDEWVLETRVLKYNEANLQKQKELQKQYASALKGTKKPKPEKKKEKSSNSDGKKSAKGKATDSQEKSSHSSSDSNSSPTNSGVSSVGSSANSNSQDPGTSQGPASNSLRSNKRKRTRADLSIEPEESFLARVEVKIVIPDLLKAWLVDDWDLITRQKKLLQLPARVTVDQILQNYVTFKSTAKGNPPFKENVIKEVISGLKDYFNVMLGNQLLYRFERPQYGEILAANDGVAVSGIYGTIPLIRLFVKLGGMLAYTPLDERNMAYLLTYVHDILKFIVKNAGTLLSLNDYAIATPEYNRRALI